MFIIVIASGVLVLAAGCMGHVETGKSDMNVTSSVPPTSPIATTTEIEPSQISQEGYWIKIDPISDKQAGDLFTINASTNLSAGNEILVQIYNSRIVRNITGTLGTVKVIQGTGGINTISFVVNSSEFKPDEYIVTEEALGLGTFDIAFFNIFQKPVSSGNVTLKPKNFIDWEKLDLPPLKINNSMQPENPPFAIPDSEKCQTTNGSIILFSTDGIVRIFDKSGAQTGACYNSADFHSHGIPSGSMINIRGNVTTVTVGGERILTEIHEADN
jgi:hypothetical protein